VVDAVLEERRNRILENTIKNTRTPRFYVEDGSVYVITNPAFPGMVKIGWAADPEKRLGDYVMYAPTPFKLEGYYHASSIEAERRIHAWLSLSRANGEWFRIAVNDALVIVCWICGQLPYNKENNDASLFESQRLGTHFAGDDCPGSHWEAVTKIDK